MRRDKYSSFNFCLIIDPNHFLLKLIAGFSLQVALMLTNIQFLANVKAVTRQYLFMIVELNLAHTCIKIHHHCAFLFSF